MLVVFESVYKVAIRTDTAVNITLGARSLTAARSLAVTIEARSRDPAAMTINSFAANTSTQLEGLALGGGHASLGGHVSSEHKAIMS